MIRISFAPSAALAALILFVAPALAGTSAVDPGIVAPGATIQRIATGFAFTEGPACDSDGNVYFTDQPNDRIMKWEPPKHLAPSAANPGKFSLFLSPCGRSNGLCFDNIGNIIACADEHNQLWRIAPHGNVTVLVKSYDGKLLDGPNDIWVRPDGGMYITDPYYKRDYWTRGPAEQSTEGVYYLSPGGTLTRVIDDFIKPNGIIGTPDGKTLYVSDIGAWKTWVYDIDKSGALSNKRLFCTTGSDGMTIDSLGDIYICGHGVTIVDKTGRQIDHLDIPEAWTGNICFGGRDRSTLFITASHSIYTLQMSVHGVGSQ